MENKEDIAAALAAGGEIEYRNSDGWHTAREYRIKVAPPKPEYPASTIRYAELRKAWIEDGCGSYLDFDKAIARACADAGLRHAFETGTAVPKAEHEAALERLGEQLRGVAITEKRYTTTELTLDRYREVVREEMAARELAIAEAAIRATRQSAHLHYAPAKPVEIVWEVVEPTAIVASVP